MLKSNKETQGMDYTQRRYCKDKNEFREVWTHVEKMYTRKMNSNMSKLYIVLRWACHLSRVIGLV
jgi:hypothetical protein